MFSSRPSTLGFPSSGLSLSLTPLTLGRSSSASTNLMHDMPNTPTRESFTHSYPPPSSIPTPPPPPPSSTASTASSSSSSSSQSSSPTPTTRTVIRAQLTRLVLPCFSHKTTRLLFSLILITTDLILLYFTSFSFYLTHLLQSSESDASCATFTLSIFLVFVFFRTLCSLLLIGIRIKDASMWVNQRTQMAPHQKMYHVIMATLYAFSVAFVCFGFVWLTSSEADTCVAMAAPLVSAIVGWETFSVILPPLMLAMLAAVYPWRSLSPFCPYIPLTAEAFVPQGKTGLSRRDIKSLPSFVYTQGRYADDDHKCSICLCDVEVGERVRELGCRHHFHQPCLDSWISQRASCPLCVRKVERERLGSKLKKKWRLSISRTRTSLSRTTPNADRDVSTTAARTSPQHGTEPVAELEVDQALEMV